MKNILLLIALIYSGVAFAQIPVYRSSSAVTALDSRSGAILNFIVPVCPHTPSLNGGLDSLGSICYVTDSSAIFFRDTLLSGGHKWTKIASGSIITATLQTVTLAGNTTPLPITTGGYFTTNSLAGLSETGSSFGQVFTRDSINHASAVYFGRGVHVLNYAMNDSVFYHPTTNAKDSFAYLSDIRASGGSQTWQQTLDATNGSILTHDNTIDGGTNNLTYQNVNNLTQNIIANDSVNTGQFFNLHAVNGANIFTPNSIILASNSGNSGGSTLIQDQTSNTQFTLGKDFVLNGINPVGLDLDTLHETWLDYIGLGVHTRHPAYPLSVIGTVQIKDGTQAAGNIFTCDANGVGSWKNTSITGLIDAGTNITIDGSGTSGSPYVINSSGGGGGEGSIDTSRVWERQGIIIPPTTDSDENTTQEPTGYLRDTSFLLAGRSKCIGVWHTRGWNHTDVMYAESPDGKTPYTQYAYPVFPGHRCSYPYFDPIDHIWHLFAASENLFRIDEDTSTSGAPWSFKLKQAGVVVAADSLSGGLVANSWVTDSSGTWEMVLDRFDGQWHEHLYTGTSDVSFTDRGAILPAGFEAADCHFINGKWYNWSIGDTAGTVTPTDIYTFYSTSLWGGWSAHGLPTLNRRQGFEGANTAFGQLGDPMLLVMPDSTTALLYDGSTNGEDISGHQQIGIAISKLTLSQIVQTSQGDGGYTINPVPFVDSLSPGQINPSYQFTKIGSQLFLLKPLTINSQTNATINLNSWSGGSNGGAINFQYGGITKESVAWSPSANIVIYDVVNGQPDIQVFPSHNVTIGNAVTTPSADIFGTNLTIHSNLISMSANSITNTFSNASTTPNMTFKNTNAGGTNGTAFYNDASKGVILYVAGSGYGGYGTLLANSAIFYSSAANSMGFFGDNAASFFTLSMGGSGTAGFEVSSSNNTLIGSGTDNGLGKLQVTGKSWYSDTLALVKQASYTGNVHSLFTQFSLVDKKYVDSTQALNVNGVYTPTLTNVTNVSSSTANQFTYSRVGNVVTYAGSINVTTSLAAASEVDFSLPIASAFSSDNDLNGSGNAKTAVGTNIVNEGDAVNDRGECEFLGVAISGSGTIFISGQYIVK